MDIIKSIEHEQLKHRIPELSVGNTVKVYVKIKEGNKERIQVFEGIIIKVQGGGVNQTFTVRKTSYGVGVEKTFLVHSPLVEKVELVRVGKARRAKLFYLRDRIGKKSKTKEQVGARIEDREIIIKEEIVEEPVAEEVIEETVEVAEVTETPVVEEVAVEETPVVEEVVEEVAPVVEEKTTEVESIEAPEEAPAVETEAVEVQEVVDTVKEEVVEEVTEVEEAPVAEEVAVEEAPEVEAKETEKTDKA